MEYLNAAVKPILLPCLGLNGQIDQLATIQNMDKCHYKHCRKPNDLLSCFLLCILSSSLVGRIFPHTLHSWLCRPLILHTFFERWRIRLCLSVNVLLQLSHWNAGGAAVCCKVGSELTQTPLRKCLSRLCLCANDTPQCKQSIGWKIRVQFTRSHISFFFIF